VVCCSAPTTPRAACATSAMSASGFTERALDELLELLNPLIRPTSPFQDEVPADRRRDVRWVQPRMVGQVVYRQFTTDLRLRHTAWRGLRHDVLPEQVRWPSSE
jgi:bifunctional non-homologous end joining protein LigD